MTVRPRRSALYMPASNQRAIDKARSLPCDVVILDLEDAVAPEAKEEARANAVRAVRDGGFGDRELVIRVNALGTPWAQDDLAAAAAVRPDAILAPKVGDAETVHRYLAALAEAPPTTGFWAMIESCRAIFRLDAIAAAMAVRPGAFVLGTNDLAKEMGARLTVERTPFLGMMAMAVAAAKGHGLAALDDTDDVRMTNTAEQLALEHEAHDFGEAIAVTLLQKLQRHARAVLEMLGGIDA